ncbi:DNA primase, partial [Streptomyces sp. NPDC048663]
EGAGFSDTLNRAAYTLGGLIAAGRLERRDAEEALRQTAAAARPGQELRIEQIIRSGLTAGLNKPLHATGRRP